MAETRTAGLTYDDLLRMFPEEDHVRRELHDGRLYVMSSPQVDHQRVIAHVAFEALAWARRSGGEVLFAPLDVAFAPDNVKQPDLLVYGPGRRADKRPVSVLPDLVVEVSSGGSRRYDLGIRLETYERFGIPEYWFIDLDRQQIEVRTLMPDGSYGAATVLAAGATLQSRLSDLTLEIAGVFDAAQES